MITPRARAAALCLLAVLSAFAPDLAAQDPPVEKKRTTVHVKISADAPLKKELEGHIEAALRELPDVVLADKAPDYTISIIALKVATNTRRDVGTAFSIIVTAPIDPRIRQLETDLASDTRQRLGALLAPAVEVRAHWIETAAPGGLREVCRGVVQSFDKDVLNAKRPPQRP